MTFIITPLRIFLLVFVNAHRCVYRSRRKKRKEMMTNTITSEIHFPTGLFKTRALVSNNLPFQLSLQPRCERCTWHASGSLIRNLMVRQSRLFGPANSSWKLIRVEASRVRKVCATSQPCVKQGSAASSGNYKLGFHRNSENLLSWSSAVILTHSNGWISSWNFPQQRESLPSVLQLSIE